nr:AAA family ATPase [uncultured Actinoplanes sp.]
MATVNPFPRQATVALESMAGIAAAMPTIEREPLRRLTGLANRYLGEPAQARVGRAVAVHGEHGTGKTHALLATLERVTGEDPHSSKPFVLYGRADAPDPLTLYRNLLRQITRSDLRELVTQAFAAYAAGSFENDWGHPLPSADADRLRAEPDLVLTAIRSQELSRTSVIGQQERDLERVEGSATRFERTVRAVLSPARSAGAFTWLTGGDVEADELKRLGVDGNLADATDVRMALHVLAVLAMRAGRPFVLAIDQAEVLLRGPDDRLEQRNVGLLRALIEEVPHEQGFIVVSMNELVWRALPVDVRQRFGPSEILTQGLTSTEAVDIIKAYLGGALWPFGRGAVRRLLATTGGNLRRFLQGCHVAFSAAEPDSEITADSVDEALRREAAAITPEEHEIRSVIEHSVAQRGWQLTDAAPAGDGYLIQQRPGHAVTVRLNGPIFEKGQVTGILDAIGHDSQVILIVSGYVSFELLETLQARVPVVVATHDGLEDDLSRALDAVAVDSGDSDLRRRLDELQAEIRRLGEARERETDQVTARIRDVLVQQDVGRQEEQLRLSRRAWAAEQQRIADAVTAARRDRQKAEFDEIRELHGEYKRGRDRFFRLTFGVATVFVVLVAVAITTLARTNQTGVDWLTHSFSIIPAGLTAAVLAFYSWTSVRDPVESRVLTLDDLHRLALSTSERSTLADLRSGDPYRRYAFAFKAETAEASTLDLSTSRLIHTAEVEASSLVRRQLARACTGEGRDGVLAVLRSSLDPATMTVAMESPNAQHVEDLQSDIDEMPPALRALAALNGMVGKNATFIETFLALVTEGPRLSRVRTPAERSESLLASAYITDDDRLLTEALPRIRERELRRALETLDPLNTDGLGSFYWLKQADEIKEAYLFLRKALFTIDRGLDSLEVSTEH